MLTEILLATRTHLSCSLYEWFSACKELWRERISSNCSILILQQTFFVVWERTTSCQASCKVSENHCRVHASLYGFSLRQMWLECITEVWKNFTLHVCYWMSCSSPALHSCMLKSWFLKEKLSVCTNLTPFCRMFFQDVCSSCVWEYSTCSGQTCPL